MDKHCNARERVTDLDKIPTDMDTDMGGILLTYWPVVLHAIVLHDRITLGDSTMIYLWYLGHSVEDA